MIGFAIFDDPCSCFASVFDLNQSSVKDHARTGKTRPDYQRASASLSNASGMGVE
jgi:hypothetical protein